MAGERSAASGLWGESCSAEGLVKEHVGKSETAIRYHSDLILDKTVTSVHYHIPEMMFVSMTIWLCSIQHGTLCYNCRQSGQSFQKLDLGESPFPFPKEQNNISTPAPKPLGTRHPDLPGMPLCWMLLSKAGQRWHQADSWWPGFPQWGQAQTPENSSSLSLNCRPPLTFHSA